MGEKRLVKAAMARRCSRQAAGPSCQPDRRALTLALESRPRWRQDACPSPPENCAARFQPRVRRRPMSDDHGGSHGTVGAL